MEFQQDFLGRDSKSRDKKLLQVWMPEERKRDWALWCHQKGFTGGMSQAVNMIIVKILDDEHTMHDPRTLQPIEDAINDIKEIIPVMRKTGFLQRFGK